MITRHCYEQLCGYYFGLSLGNHSYLTSICILSERRVNVLGECFILAITFVTVASKWAKGLTPVRGAPYEYVLT